MMNSRLVEYGQIDSEETIAHIPVIDFSLYQSDDQTVRQQVADRIRYACTNVGFLYLKHHGIPQSFVDQMFAVSKHFFDLPIKVKDQIPWDSPECNCGYIGMQTQHLDPNAPGDLMEAYNIGLLQPRASEKWLTDQQHLNQTLLEFYTAGAQVCQNIMGAFALSLGLPESFFEPTHNLHYSTVRLLHYPPAPTHVKPGQIRAGAHSDYGTITLLFQDEVGGLEILHNGEWLPAPYIPGTVIVNTGDLMERWTNNFFRSTRHRVVVPPEPAARRSRYSATFFYRPNIDAEIVCLEPCRDPNQAPLYPPTTTREHLINCLRASHQVES